MLATQSVTQKWKQSQGLTTTRLFKDLSHVGSEKKSILCLVWIFWSQQLTDTLAFVGLGGLPSLPQHR